MKIVRLDRAGFCFGVRRATELALALRARGGPVRTLGPLMHNPQEVERLRGLGVEPADRIEACGAGPVVVRTHGIARTDVELAARLGVELVDATCPHVLRARREILRFGREGRTVVLAGDCLHPEVRAQVSFATGPIHVAACPEELPALPPETRVGLVAQTTLTPEDLGAIEAALRARHPDTVVAPTLCDDARLRQAEAAVLAARVDAVVVVGGLSSANTSRLASICRRIQPRCFHVESAAALRAEDFSGVATVGLAAGASTPDWLIDEVAAWLADPLVQAAASKENSFDTRGQSQ